MGTLVKRTLPVIAALFLAFLISAAAFQGFYAKWGFRDDAPRFSLKSYLDGTTAKPFAYRRLVPDMANAIDAAMPTRLRDSLTRHLRNIDGSPISRSPAQTAADPVYILRYHLVYYGVFACMFATFGAGFLWLRRLGWPPLAAFAASAALLIVMPWVQSIGGYFYDYVELFLMLAFLIAARCGGVAGGMAMIAIAAVGAWNKESFLFFVPCALPFMPVRWSIKAKGLVIAAGMAAAGAVYLLQRWRFADNDGSATEQHLIGHIWFFLKPPNMLGHEQTYGVPGPTPFSIIGLAALAGVAIRGWPMLDAIARRHILIAGAINLPLYVLLGFPGEIRGLSMLLPGLLMLIAAAFASWSAPALEPVAPRSTLH